MFPKRKQLAKELRKEVQHTEHQKATNQDAQRTSIFFITSIFFSGVSVEIGMCGSYITQNFTSGSILPKELTVETQMYSHSSSIHPSSQMSEHQTDHRGTEKQTGAHALLNGPHKRGVQHFSTCQHAENIIHNEVSLVMGQMPFYSVRMKYLEWPNS